MCICFGETYFPSAIRGWKFRDETPSVRSVEPFTYIARNYLHWLEHRRALAGEWFFVELIRFIVTLCAILIVASVVWCASTFYILACRPFLKLLKFKKKLTFMRPVTPDDVAPIVTASAALDVTTAGKWIGVAVLTGVVALWSLLLGWAICTAESQFVVFACWSAVGCFAVGFGLCVVAGAFDNDDVGTLGFLAFLGAAISTALVLAALFASVA